ncbi:AbfB domain-containing protein [Methylobacterium sp. SyP6R]|uniref:AbfB domain-containing protein n=1 Tax=Methylobacterium sp. SyP6R TaxID=2718876 RepID=UPI001F003EEB|nr:AbfB domain-containing protein [Methylobacterium sp. SyP6R]MCF4128762.1 AbfB domain-containing protein [Methylobacterium sp. SyP6R]
MTAAIQAGRRPRLRDAALLSATILGAGLLSPAQAAQFGVVVNQVPDPMLAGLSIPANAPTQGLWSGVYNWPINAIALGLMPNGKVVSYGTPVNNPGTQDGRTFDIWDPTQGLNAGGAHTTLQGVVGINSFCSSQTFRFDGTLMSAGGIFDNGNDKGSVILNSSATALTANAAKLGNDRYYSTMLTLPNGQQLIMGGDYPYAVGWSDPQGSINQGYNTGMTPELYDGTKWNTLFGANSRDAFGPDNSRYWFPRAWIAPNGKVFGISSDKMWFLDPTGNGSVAAMAFKAPPQSANSATAAPNTGPASTAVMYDTGKILQVGGNSMTNGDGGYLASSLATTIDINGTAPIVAETSPMKYGRAWSNSTVLPTGQVAVTGGSLFNDTADNNTVLQTEIWSPSSGQWTAAASAAIYRGYHSTVILMPNGALLSAGGGAPGPVNNQNAEIYYPPYLFAATGGTAALAPRPSIVSLSSLQLSYGRSLQFELTSQNGLSQVVLIGTSLVTHSFNATQRRYSASFSTSGNAVTVQAPASGNLAPPGYYQLVAIDKNGVPSPGIIIALGANVTAPAQATAFVTPAQGGTGTGGGTGGGSAGGGTGGSGGGYAGGVGTTGTGATVSLQSSNYTTSYLTNVGGTARLVTPANASDKQQATFRQVPGLAGSGVSFQASTNSSQYLRHQNFQLWQQPNDGSDLFKSDTTFTPRAGLAGSCGCNTGTCTSYESVNWPGYYVRHQNFSFYIAKPDGGPTYNQDASFCVAPPADGSSAMPAANGQWTPIGVAASRVSVGTDGTLVTLNADTKVPWRYVSDNTWTPLPGNFTDIAVLSATSIYGVGTDTNVYRYNGQSWTQVGTNAKSIAAADGTILIANGNNDIWLKQADDNANAWKQLPGKALRVAVMNRNSLWHIGLDNNVYRGDQGGNWVAVGNSAAEIAASPDGSVVVTNTASQLMWRKTGDDTVGNWALVDPSFKATALTVPNAQRAIVVGLDRTIYRY